MITIRKTQIDILSNYVRKNFEAASLRDLKEKYPRETKPISDHDLLNLIKTGIEKAAKYNIINREEVFTFLEYMICYGNDFDKTLNTKWIGQILLTNNISGAQKINEIRIALKKENEGGQTE